MFTVLFTSAGRRVELIQAFRQSLQNQSVNTRIIATDLNPGLASACHFADAAYPLPKCNEDNYLKILIDICIHEQVDLLIPLYEPEFAFLNQSRHEFEIRKTNLLLSNRHTLETCRDKWLTHQFFLNNGIKTPLSWTGDTLPKQGQLPLFAKPRKGMGSIGIKKIISPEQLLLQRTPEILLQEFISGREYTLDILSDLSGKVISVVPRERLEVRSGEVSKSRTVKRDDLIKDGKEIVETLGAIGPVTLQCIDTGQDVYWIEINPRFGGGVPLSIAAGVDYPYLLYRMCTRQPVQPIIGQFKDNLTMLRYDQAVYF